MAGLFSGAASLLFPDRCVLCGQPVPTGDLSCRRCEEALPPPGPPTAELTACCQSLAPLGYRDQVRRAVLRLKNEGDLRAAAYLAGKMATLVRDACPGLPFDCVAYVPMQPQREERRGYNQARVLADLVAQSLDLPVADGLLRREGVFVQHQLSAAFRQKSAQAAFLPGEGASLPAGARVLLVDDVVSTGSTVIACVRILRDLGAAPVVVLSAAR